MNVESYMHFYAKKVLHNIMYRFKESRILDLDNSKTYESLIKLSSNFWMLPDYEYYLEFPIRETDSSEFFWNDSYGAIYNEKYVYDKGNPYYDADIIEEVSGIQKY